MAQDATHIQTPFRSSSGPSKLAVGATCALVACACLSYMAWTFSDEHARVPDSHDGGVILSVGDASEIELKTPITASNKDGDETPLELDNSIETDGLPVINAHLEVPTSVEPQQLRDLPDSQLRQLSHENSSAARSSAGSAGAWLTGTIEGSLAHDESKSTVSRYLR